MHAVTSLDGNQATAADLAKLARGQWGIESVPISLLYLSGVTEITRTLQAIARDRNRVLDYLPL